jgi:transcriptional regulator with XRE-family HTH domain
LFKKEFVRQVYAIALLGGKEEEIADILGVSVRTVNYWKSKSSEFLHALKSGKIGADANVADSLYQRALGYSHKAVKIFADPKTGKKVIVPFTERFPPDTTACIFWLKNRQRELWRDKFDVEHDVSAKLAERLRAARTRTERWGEGESRT